MVQVRHLAELVEVQAACLGPRAAVRFKREGMWVDLSWEELGERVRALARGWISLGLELGERVAVLAENRVEWLLADLGILSAGGVAVPLHAPLGAAAVRGMLGDCGAVAVLVSNDEQAGKIRAIVGELASLRAVVCLAPLSSLGRGVGGEGLSHVGELQAARTLEGGWGVGEGRLLTPSPSPRRGEGGQTAPVWMSLLEIEQRGRTASAAVHDELRTRHEMLTRNHLASILYTSGTTGEPKGVMLTHGNFLFNATAMHEALGPFPPEAIFFNWLPLSHVYARTVDYYLPLIAGGTIALAESAETAVRDLGEIRPMHLSSVPRFYEKILGSVASLSVEERAVRLKQIFGTRLGWLGCGGAVLPAGVAETYREARFEVVVGYGLTECSPVITTNRLGANKLGTVGQAIPGVEVRIAADGEILTRGPHVMKGYWNRPDATAETLQDGWLNTGDLGYLDAEGFLVITGRKKDLIVLSNGKKVAPAAIEGRLAMSPFIEQAVVFGEGRPYLVAIIVPRAEAGDRDLLAHIDELLADLSTWEKVRKIVVSPRPFQVGREELTVSLKVRRGAILENYRQEIERLYANESHQDSALGQFSSPAAP